MSQTFTLLFTSHTRLHLNRHLIFFSAVIVYARINCSLLMVLLLRNRFNFRLISALRQPDWGLRVNSLDVMLSLNKDVDILEASNSYVPNGLNRKNPIIYDSAEKTKS